MRRLDTARGPIFVRPGSRSRAVVYVHGYFNTAESAIRKHGLATQFPTDATLIIPEAPASRDQPVLFPDLDQLLVLAGAPGARVMALGHSGGFRTLRRWLASQRLRELVLLDAAYGDTEPFISWGKKEGGRIKIVGFDTASKSKKIAGALGVPYHQGRGHTSIVRDEGWIARFVSESRTLASSPLVPLVLVAGAGYALYRWLR